MEHVNAIMPWDSQPGSKKPKDDIRIISEQFWLQSIFEWGMNWYKVANCKTHSDTVS